MSKSYEYKFVRVGEFRGSAFLGVQNKARESYQRVAHEHAAAGWRLVQIFAPGIAVFGASKYYELIFERETHREVELDDLEAREPEAALQS